MMKKICYITTLSLSIKAFFIPQLKYLQQNGFDVSVICSPDDELQSLLGDEIKFIPVKIPRGIHLKETVGAINQLVKIFKQEKFDLVQYSTPNAALCASIAAKRAKIKIRNYHLMGLRYLGDYGLKRRLLRSFERLTCRNSTHIECVSNSNLRLAIEEKLFDAKKGTVVWNGSSGGVDINRFDVKKSASLRKKMRDDLGINESEFVYGFVGRVTRDKGINELICAFEAIKPNYPSTLVMVGGLDTSHGLSEELLDKLRTTDNLIWLPQTNVIEEYYPIFDALVLPSYREGFGNVLIEAGAMGVPCIAFDIPGPVDIIENGKTGFLVEYKNVSDLASKMVEIRKSGSKEFSNSISSLVTNKFDSEKLCEHILKRKQSLLEDDVI